MKTTDVVIKVRRLHSGGDEISLDGEKIGTMDPDRTDCVIGYRLSEGRCEEITAHLTAPGELRCCGKCGADTYTLHKCGCGGTAVLESERARMLKEGVATECSKCFETVRCPMGMYPPVCYDCLEKRKVEVPPPYSLRTRLHSTTNRWLETSYHW